MNESTRLTDDLIRRAAREQFALELTGSDLENMTNLVNWLRMESKSALDMQVGSAEPATTFDAQP